MKNILASAITLLAIAVPAMAANSPTDDSASRMETIAKTAMFKMLGNIKESKIAFLKQDSCKSNTLVKAEDRTFAFELDCNGGSGVLLVDIMNFDDKQLPTAITTCGMPTTLTGTDNFAGPEGLDVIASCTENGEKPVMIRLIVK